MFPNVYPKPCLILITVASVFHSFIHSSWVSTGSCSGLGRSGATPGNTGSQAEIFQVTAVESITSRGQWTLNISASCACNATYFFHYGTDRKLITSEILRAMERYITTSLLLRTINSSCSERVVAVLVAVQHKQKETKIQKKVLLL